MKKRGQLASQIFIYILGILTVGLLLLVGIKAIDTLQQNQCDVRETQFVTQLATAIEKNKGWGVSRVQDFTLPCETKSVCFVSRTTINLGQDAVLTAYEAQYPTIVASILSGDTTNVFIEGNDGAFSPVPRFTVAAPVELRNDEAIICIGGEPARIRFEGQGATVEVRDERNS